MDIEKSLKTINEICAKNALVIDNVDQTIINQIVKIWKKEHGTSAYPHDFFDTIISTDYFGLLFTIGCYPNLIMLSRSPVDYIMFEHNSKGIATDQWINRTQLLTNMVTNKVKSSDL